MRRTLFEPDHVALGEAFSAFLKAEAVPHIEDWERAGTVDREFITRAGASGFLGFEAPVEYGGQGISDFRYNAIMTETVVASGIAGDTFVMHNDIVAPYLLTLTDDDQQRRWLPGFTSGATVPALAMTEPGAGSDVGAIRTSAVRDGEHLVINGSKTFITNGASCDLAIVLVRTGEREGRGTSLVVVERGNAGFSQGAPMHKIGRRGQDTAELFFSDCRVPLGNVIGTPGIGFADVRQRLARERLSIAALAIASADAALAMALDHVRQREAFGGPLTQQQSVRFAIADMHTEIQIGRAYIDRCILALNDAELSAQDAAGAKYWATDLQWRVVDECLQLFGGYGYMEEYPIARLWRDSRVQRIYGGANEVMREIVGKAVVADV
ncbi:MAG: acyl-CoA dehydrogenase family protein [Nostocoides sp.]